MWKFSLDFWGIRRQKLFAFEIYWPSAPLIRVYLGIYTSSFQLPLDQQLRSHYLSCMLCSSSRLNISILQLSLRFCKERESKKECAISLLSPKPGNISLLELQDHNTILHYVSIYRTRAIITCGLYIFYPNFYYGLYCRAISFYQ